MKRVLAALAAVAFLAAAAAAQSKLDQAIAKAEEQLSKGKPDDAVKTMTKAAADSGAEGQVALARVQERGGHLDAAAEAYFGKNASALRLHEIALLVGLPQAPSRFDPECRPEDARARRKYVLNRLLDGFEGKLTSSKWARIEKCSPDTALRDITDLRERGILVKDEGGGRSTSYSLVDVA